MRISNLHNAEISRTVKPGSYEVLRPPTEIHVRRMRFSKLVTSRVARIPLRDFLSKANLSYLLYFGRQRNENEMHSFANYT